MSLNDYQSALPDIFKAPSSGDGDRPGHTGDPSSGIENNEVQISSKKFADIIEYHTEGLHGPDVKILPSERFIPHNKKKKRNLKKYDDFILVLRRTWKQHENVAVLIRLELEIQSETLCNAFREAVVDVYDGIDLVEFPIKLQSPFQELFFYRDQIESWAEGNGIEPHLHHDAKILRDFIHENGLLSSIIADHKKYSKEDKVVSDILWTIYRPNSLLVATTGRLRECWICRDVSLKRAANGEINLIVTGLRVGFDGEKLGMIRKEFYISTGGTHLYKISTLPVVPLDLFEGREGLEKTMRARARKLRKVLGNDFTSFQPQNYTSAAFGNDSQTYMERPVTLSQDFTIGKKIDERVVVDFVSYREQGYDLPPLENLRAPTLSKQRKIPFRGFFNKQMAKETTRRHRHKYRPWDSSDSSSESSGNEATEDFSKLEMEILNNKPFSAMTLRERDELDASGDSMSELKKTVSSRFHILESDFDFLFPALVPAFGLKSKDWSWVLSDSLRDVAWNPAAFSSLQIADDTKNLVQSLVKGHKDNSVVFDDFMPGKGQGLVFLLHGSPGLGKTLTAESVADYLERPLYSISGGELGTDVDEVESRLNIIFDLTKRWNAVVLLDEADVLLCKRNSADIYRNAIVGVFLRKLEYFQGVWFLTTNRKDDFDEAFKSRIHVTISFSPLAHEVQADIWAKLIESNKLKGLEVDSSWNTRVFGLLGRLGLNGRVIKNLLRTAAAYANADSGQLGLRHVLAIVKTEFSDDETKRDIIVDLEKMLNLD